MSMWYRFVHSDTVDRILDGILLVTFGAVAGMAVGYYWL